MWYYCALLHSVFPLMGPTLLWIALWIATSNSSPGYHVLTNCSYLCIPSSALISAPTSSMAVKEGEVFFWGERSNFLMIYLAYSNFLIKVPIAVIGIMLLWLKATWGGKCLFVLNIPISVYQKGKSRKKFKRATWRQELKQRPWKKASCWWVCSSWLSQPASLQDHRTSNPEMGPPILSWALPHQRSTMKRPHGLYHTTIWWRHFLDWRSLFPNDLSLCQVDIKVVSTI